MNKFTAFATLIASVFTASATNNINHPIDAMSGNATQIEAIENTEIQSLVMKVEAEPQPSATEIIAEKANRLTDFASTFLGRKYVWGATGPKHFDCSGFTSYVFRQEGIELPRTSRMQWNEGNKVERSDLQAGDLMFFSSPRSGKGKVGHVGIVVDVDPTTNAVTFIHASTSKGITYQKFPDNGYYSRNYIGAKRVLSSEA